MTKGKTLVAYVTKGGATGEAAELIAETLREKFSLEVDVVDLKKQKHPDIAPYDNVVVGGGVRGGKVYDEAVAFVKQDFGGKRVAVFTCSGTAGDPSKEQEATEKYVIEGLLAGSNVTPVLIGVFGGCMKMLGKTLYDNRDPSKIRAWAEEVGKKFTE
jgi:menaquinone-dependent protoporphyrinogen IX oxidase